MTSKRILIAVMLSIALFCLVLFPPIELLLNLRKFKSRKLFEKVYP